LREHDIENEEEDEGHDYADEDVHDLHDQDNSVPTLGGDASGEIRLRYELKM
jgi:hypothetical protein